jgi:hypothetical protein
MLSLLIGISLFYYYKYKHQQSLHNLDLEKYELGLEAVEINYGKLIEKEAEHHSLNVNYLKALCMLECGGRKKIPARFEKHIYRKLTLLKKGKIKRYEDIKTASISMLSDDAIKNLSKSWGPFQIMGYKAIGLNCKIVDLRNQNAIKYGTLWIHRNYGKVLKAKKYKDAFHIHNTGKVYPKVGPSRTHDPLYVVKGLKFMKYFSLKSNQ